MAVRVHSLVRRCTGGAALVREGQAWLASLARLTLLALLGLILIPFMAGLYLDLVMLPFRSVRLPRQALVRSIGCCQQPNSQPSNNQPNNNTPNNSAACKAYSPEAIAKCVAAAGLESGPEI